MSKKIIVNNSRDGFSEISIIGDIELYDADYICKQIANVTGKKLRIRINSFGGNVTSGMSIISAMIDFKSAGGVIETVNEGKADSTAGWIFAMGTKGYRKVLPWSSMILHDPAYADGRTLNNLVEGSDEHNQLKEYKTKLVSIFNFATGIAKNQIESMMSIETDLKGSDIVKKGFADKIEDVDCKVPDLSNMTANEIVNTTKNINYKNKKNMSKIALLLGLNPEASEEAIASAVQDVLNKRTEAENNLIASNKQVSNLKTERDQLKSSYLALKDKEIVDYVGAIIEADSSKAEIKAEMINMAKSDFDTFKRMNKIEVKNASKIDKDIDEDGAGANADAAEIENAKKFAGMSVDERNNLKSSSYSEYCQLAENYDKHFDKL